MAYDTVVDKAVLENGLTEIADKIRAELEMREPIAFPSGMAAELDRAFTRKNISLQQAKNELKSVIERTVTDIFNEDVVRVAPYSFYLHPTLKTANFPNTASIGESAFYNCSTLQSISAENAGIIGVQAFKNCTNLTSAYLPKVYEIRVNAFDGCTKLERIDLSSAQTIGQYAFASCTALTILDLPKATSIGNHAFRKSSNLKTLILRSDSVVSLGGTGAFYGVDFCTVYVPNALIEAYKADAAWGALYSDGICEFLASDLITFTIVTPSHSRTETYQAEEGMTWAQWCESEYNTSEDHWRINDSDCLENDNGFWVTGGGSGCELGDYIIQAIEYTAFYT